MQNTLSQRRNEFFKDKGNNEEEVGYGAERGEAENSVGSKKTGLTVYNHTRAKYASFLFGFPKIRK